MLTMTKLDKEITEIESALEKLNTKIENDNSLDPVIEFRDFINSFDDEIKSLISEYIGGIDVGTFLNLHNITEILNDLRHIDMSALDISTGRISKFHVFGCITNKNNLSKLSLLGKALVILMDEEIADKQREYLKLRNNVFSYGDLWYFPITSIRSMEKFNIKMDDIITKRLPDICEMLCKVDFSFNEEDILAEMKHLLKFEYLTIPASDISKINHDRMLKIFNSSVDDRIREVSALLALFVKKIGNERIGPDNDAKLIELLNRFTSLCSIKYTKEYSEFVKIMNTQMTKEKEISSMYSLFLLIYKSPKGMSVMEDIKTIDPDEFTTYIESMFASIQLDQGVIENMTSIGVDKVNTDFFIDTMDGSELS